MASPILDQLAGKVDLYRADPVQFVREFFGVSPTEQQAKILHAFAQPGAHVSVSSGHGIGKSAAISWAIFWMLTCFEFVKCPCTAPSKHQLRDVLWSELALWHPQIPAALRANYVLKGERLYRVDAPENAFAVARTSRKENPEALQGFHSPNLAFFGDEASGIPQAIFEAGRGSLSTPGARILIDSNPTQTQGYFYDSHHRNRDRWVRFQFSSLDSPLVDPMFAKEIAEEYGEDSDMYRVRVLGRFPRASVAQLIPTDLVEAAMQRQHPRHIYSHAPRILGVDVAWEGDDRSSVVLRQGLMSQILGLWRHADSGRIAEFIARYAEKNKVEAIFVDQGWGAGVIDRLRALGLNPVPVNFGDTSGSERYANKRSEMWGLLREWLESGGALPFDMDLELDLTGPMYAMTPSAKIQLESKKAMKLRKLPSPDLGDAYALTFAAPVGGYMGSPEVHVPVVESYRAQTEWDVLNGRPVEV